MLRKYKYCLTLPDNALFEIETFKYKNTKENISSF